MKMLIHDFKNNYELKRVYSAPLNGKIVISNDRVIHHCLRCFACWVKTPAVCIIQDNCGDMGESLSKCKEITIISKCCYGGFSPFVKNVLDRSISYLHPYFEIKRGELHHKRRYRNQIDIYIKFYGEDISENEKKTANGIVKANAINFGWNVKEISFEYYTEKLGGQIS